MPGHIKTRYILLVILALIGATYIWRASDGIMGVIHYSTDPISPPIQSAYIPANIETTPLPPRLAENNPISRGNYETIQETIARIKRDVNVTGTILGAPGQETALFQIEGMADRSFKINTQLMDGFIITQITNKHVVLKNQIGNETFALDVKGNSSNEAPETLSGGV